MLKLTRIILLGLLIHFMNCNGLSSEQKSAIINIFVENQKIQDILLQNPKENPKIDGLLNSLNSALPIFKGNKAESDLSASIGLAKSIDISNIDSYFESLSQISEKLGTLVDKKEFPEYHLFYCPMVKKHWVAKGETLANPYASDMRDCGELVK